MNRPAMKPPARLSTPDPSVILRRACSYLILLLAAGIGMASAQSDQAQKPAEKSQEWHVELLLFAHPDSDIAWHAVAEIGDFSKLTVQPSMFAQAGDPGRMAASLNLTEDQLFASEPMHKAWLRLQKEYQLLGYYQWQQPAGIGRRWRIHDDQLLIAASQAVSTELDDDATASDQQPATSDELTYQLDGSIKINTGYIGTVDLNVEQRSEVLYFRSTSDTPSAAGASNENPEQPQYRARYLQQQRRIQSERMEYFDSSGLAALVLISQVVASEDPAASEQADTELTADRSE
jgi:hypothetical protein